MSDHGPYQSRLLNLLVPKYRRLVEKGDRAIRQMQVAASWAAQVMIYPVYLLLQTTRLAFRQLGQAVKSQLPQLQASVEALDGYDVDTPIGQVLLAVLPEEEELVLTPEIVRPQSPQPNVPRHWDLIVNNSPLAPRKQKDIAYTLPLATPRPVAPRGGCKGKVIRGLATELTSKNLVLVTADNQELDIFTVEQQKELQQLIIWQLAQYWRHQRQLAAGKKPPTWSKLAMSQTTLLPIRILGQVMAWEQKGTVARAIDLFGESSLGHQSSRKLGRGVAEAHASLSKLDSLIAALEKGQISIIREGPTAIELKNREITESRNIPESVTDVIAREKQNIFVLLGAAIAYFFGNKEGDKNLPVPREEKVQQLTGSFERRYLGRPEAEVRAITGDRAGQSQAEVQVQDWITWSDIFGTPGVPGGKKQKPTPGQSAQNRVRGNQQLDNADYKRKKAVAQPSGASTAESVGSMVATTASGGQPDQQEPNDNNSIELTPDWIETVATPSGYVKHPLEKILAWLDRGLLWLEDRALGIWKWFVRQ